MILPILTYGADIWGYEDLKMIENVHLSFIRKVLCCKKGTPICMLYGETGRQPLLIDIKVKAITFWGKLLTGNLSKISSIL